MTGTDCGLFTHKSIPVIFESPCTIVCSVFHCVWCVLYSLCNFVCCVFLSVVCYFV
jgi:hypothetical protein